MLLLFSLALLSIGEIYTTANTTVNYYSYGPSTSEIPQDNFSIPIWRCGNIGWKYIDGGCYSYQTVPATFFAAQLSCQALGGSLVAIRTIDQQNFITNQVACRDDYWIDAVYAAIEDSSLHSLDDWYWEDGTFTNFTYFYITNTAGACAVCNSDYNNYWIPSACDKLFPYVCYKSANMNESAPQTTAPNNDHVYSCQTNWSVVGDSCYWSSNKIDLKLDYFAAEHYCLFKFGAYGANLASILSNENALKIFTEVMQCDQSSFCSQSCNQTWIGLINTDQNQISNPSAWMWVDDSPMSVNLWQPGYPTTQHLYYQCGVIGPSGMWQNTECYEPRPFLCKTSATAQSTGTTVEQNPTTVTQAASSSTALTTHPTTVGATTQWVDTICPYPDKNPCRYNSTCKNSGHSIICACTSMYTTGANCEVCGGILPAANGSTHTLESVHYPMQFANTSCTWTIPANHYQVVQFNVTNILIGPDAAHDYLEFHVGFFTFTILNTTVIEVITNSALGNISVKFVSTSGGYFSLTYVAVDPCATFSCGSHGQCQTLSTGPSCTCVFGYYGAHCELIDPCAGNYCQNGATCIIDAANTTFGYDCQCAPGYSEPFCT